MKKIPVGSLGLFMLVDDEDFEFLSQFSWSLSANGYAKRSCCIDGKATTAYAHRYILKLEHGNKWQVDHKDRNRLNNQKANLRPATPTQNQANQGAHRDGCGLKGVCYAKGTGKWQASIKYSGKIKYLGQYATKEEAHEVYCLAADLVYGEYACHG